MRYVPSIFFPNTRRRWDKNEFKEDEANEQDDKEDVSDMDCISSGKDHKKKEEGGEELEDAGCVEWSDM